MKTGFTVERSPIHDRADLWPKLFYLESFSFHTANFNSWSIMASVSDRFYLWLTTALIASWNLNTQLPLLLTKLLCRALTECNFISKLNNDNISHNCLLGALYNQNLLVLGPYGEPCRLSLLFNYHTGWFKPPDRNAQLIM